MLCGALLGALLALDGLYARLFGEFHPALGETRFWLDLLHEQLAFPALEPAWAGWLPVVVGSALSGALAACWLGLRWGRNAVAGLATLSLLQGGVASILAAAVLLCATLPATRRWVSSSQAD